MNGCYDLGRGRPASKTFEDGHNNGGRHDTLCVSAVRQYLTKPESKFLTRNRQTNKDVKSNICSPNEPAFGPQTQKRFVRSLRVETSE